MFDKQVIPIGRIGPLDVAQLENSIGLANQVQNAYRFDLLPDRYHIAHSRYKLPNGGYDLDVAVRALAQAGTIPSPIVLFTGLPYGDRESGRKKGYFYFAEYALASNPGIAIISTYLWEHLPGDRPLQPYILLMLASLTLSNVVGLEQHYDKKSCMLDYCDDPAEIDSCLAAKGLCSDCEPVLDAKLRSGVVNVAHVAAARRLFNRAAGRHICFMIMPFDKTLRPVYDRIRRTLEDVGWVVSRADDMRHPRRITDAIAEAIWTSDLVLADLTGNNPNVFYELGMAHTLGKDVILLTQERRLPFDVAPERALFYRASERSLRKLEDQLKCLSGDRLTRP